MLLSTTSTIDNYSIDQYYGIVCHNIVIGSNLFSDLFASFSDVFGGHSGTYQSKMDNMYQEAIKNLSYKARELGANAVVGIKINFDEVSGQGKQMFMLCVTGTAVSISRKTSNRYELYQLLNSLQTFYQNGIITEEEYKYEKNKITSSYDNFLTTETNQFLIEEKAKANLQKKIAEETEKKIQMMNERLGNRSRTLNETAILNADYSNTPIDESQPMDAIIEQFIILNKIEEACKYYIDETGLYVNDAIDFVLSIENNMIKKVTQKK